MSDTKLRDLAKRMREDAQLFSDPRPFFKYAGELEAILDEMANRSRMFDFLPAEHKESQP